MKLIQPPSPQANNIVSAQGLTLTSLCFLHTLSMSTPGEVTKIADVGDWTEEQDQVRINIKASGKDIELIMTETSQLNFKCMKPLKIIIPKPRESSSTTPEGGNKIADVGYWTEEQGRVKINFTAAGKDIKLNIDEAMELQFKHLLQIFIPKQQAAGKGQGSTDQKKDEKSKEDGSSKQNTKSQEQKIYEIKLENVMSKLTVYKGIVITALIAISLGFLLRRKFKAAGN